MGEVCVGSREEGAVVSAGLWHHGVSSEEAGRGAAGSLQSLACFIQLGVCLESHDPPRAVHYNSVDT